MAIKGAKWREVWGAASSTKRLRAKDKVHREDVIVKGKAGQH